MLASLSDLYSKLEIIPVSVSGPSFCSTSHCLLTTTDYCFKKNINNFGLKKLFYSRQGFKNTCCSPACTTYKRTNSIELMIKKVSNMSIQGNTFSKCKWALT